MKVGYVRVSRQEQNPEMQRAELEADGCEQIFEERISSREESRPELERPRVLPRGGTCSWSGGWIGWDAP